MPHSRHMYSPGFLPVTDVTSYAISIGCVAYDFQVDIVTVIEKSFIT